MEIPVDNFNDTPKTFQRLMAWKTYEEKSKLKKQRKQNKKEITDIDDRDVNKSKVEHQKAIIKAIRNSKISPEKKEKKKAKLNALKEKRKSSKKEKDDDNTNGYQCEQAKFGEVAKEPPKITKLPKIVKKLGLDKRQQMHSLRSKEILEKEREIAIQQYRLLKQKKLESKQE